MKIEAQYHQSIGAQSYRLIGTPFAIEKPLRIEDDIDRLALAYRYCDESATQI
jgi:hypothetical protein